MRDDELDLAGVDQRAHTGTLPQDSQIDLALDEAYRRALSHREGRVADYIPILGAADPEAFGLCIADVRGGLHEAGDTRTRFSIQSISKAFVYALVCEGIGHHEVRELVGVDNTGLPFNSARPSPGRCWWDCSRATSRRPWPLTPSCPTRRSRRCRSTASTS